MKLTLETNNGDYAGRKLPLRASVRVTIGRGARADVVVPYDAELSEVHFEVSVEPDGAYLRDLGSTSGTQINHSTATFARLEDGDTIVAGRTQWTVVFEELPIPDAPLGLGHSSREDQGREITLADFEKAFADVDPRIVTTALEAAMWSRQEWLLPHCRARCIHICQAHMPFYDCLAIIGEVEDLPRIHTIASDESLGPQRLRLVAKFGSPELLPLLLVYIQNEDEAVSTEAWQAFRRIVGYDFREDEGENPTSYLQRNWNRLRKSIRISQGVDVSRFVDDAQCEKLDLQAKWELQVREHFRLA
ncbi:MAG: FHA domain-containing protein [Pirellulaceae bacterium]